MINRIFKYKIPEKSILGLRILNSLNSSLFAYFFILLFIFSKNFIGFTKIQLIAGNLYIIISCISFCILTINSYIKRNELKREIYFSINLPLFIFLPFSFYFILKNFYHIVKLLFFFRNF